MNHYKNSKFQENAEEEKLTGLFDESAVSTQGR